MLASQTVLRVRAVAFVELIGVTWFRSVVVYTVPRPWRFRGCRRLRGGSFQAGSTSCPIPGVRPRMYSAPRQAERRQAERLHQRTTRTRNVVDGYAERRQQKYLAGGLPKFPLGLRNSLTPGTFSTSRSRNGCGQIRDTPGCLGCCTTDPTAWLSSPTPFTRSNTTQIQVPDYPLRRPSRTQSQAMVNFILCGSAHGTDPQAGQIDGGHPSWRLLPLRGVPRPRLRCQFGVAVGDGVAVSEHFRGERRWYLGDESAERCCARAEHVDAQ